MKKRIASIVGYALSIVILGVAFYIIHTRLKEFHYHQIISAIHRLSLLHIIYASCLTFCSYWIMTFYDYLALQYIHFKLPYSKIASSSFISYSFSNSMGHPLITGAVRYRLYSTWGLNALDIAKVVAFCTFTLWLGFFFLSGMFFTIAPPKLPQGIHLPFVSMHAIGIIFLSLVALYYYLVIFKRVGIKFKEWNFELPTKVIACKQIIISSVDWFLAGSVLFILLPQGHGIHYYIFMSMYLMAQVIAIVSQVPGGIGVFESLMLIMLGSVLPTTMVMAVLLANRIIYYLIPLTVGSLIFATNEMLRQRKQLIYIANLYDRFIAPLAPQFYAILTFLGGIILLFSTATPALHHRLMILDEIVPVPVIELSHFIGSLVGISMLFLARGLQKRLDSAYYLTILVMLAGILVSMLKGFDYEEALTLCLMLLVLIPSHRHFYRKSSILNQPFTPMWIISIAMAVASTVWLGFFSYKHVVYTKELWWSFSLHGDAPRFLRELAGLAGFLLIFSMIRLTRGYTPKQKIQVNPDDIKRILLLAERTDANLAFLGDKSFLINEQRNAMLMYGIEGRNWIAMGDPIGNENDVKELCWQFRELCDRHNGRPVFYEVSNKHLDLYLDMGLTLTKIGETAKIDLDRFDMDSPGHKRHRRTLKTVESEGCSFEMIPQEKVKEVIPSLQIVSDAWLNEKHAREKGFSLGFFTPEYIMRFPVGIVRKDNEIIAFTNIWGSGNGEEMSVDLMRYIPEKVDSVMEYLFLRLILWGKEQGYHKFDLGMAPLSGLYNRTLAPLWHRLGSMIYQFGNPVYKLQGLRKYKEKFDPDWEPMYIASPGGLVLPEILINLASLISGGYKRVMKEK